MLKSFCSKKHTFPLIDGYTGEYLADVGDNEYQVPDGATVRMGRKVDYLFLHTGKDGCLCRDCAPDFNVMEWESH